MLTALDAGGSVIGVLADSLLKAATKPQYLTALKEGNITYYTFYPEQALAWVMQWVATNIFTHYQKCGCYEWKKVELGCAKENLKKQWVPLWIRDIEQSGNKKLIDLGGHLSQR